MGASPSYTGVVAGSRVAETSIHPPEIDAFGAAIRDAG
jgi:hypothetical protein